MKKSIQYTLILICALITIVSVFASNLTTYKRESAEMPTTGLYKIDQTINPYLINEPIVGEWEYYPGTFLMSGDEEASLPGKVHSFDPLKVNLKLELPPIRDGKNIDQSSTTLRSDAAHISIPAAFQNYSDTLLSTEKKASYRMVIEGCKMTGTDSLNICFPGLISGNYRLYVNGQERPIRLSSPWGYPIYTLGDVENAEIILEVSNAQQTLNICPYIISVAKAMSYFDPMKNAILVAASIMIAVFVMLLISIMSTEIRRFRLYFLTGLIFTLYFIISNLWATGYIDAVTKFIPQYMLSFMENILIPMGLLLAFLILHVSHPQVHSRRKFYVSCALVIASLLTQILFMIFPLPWLVPFIGHILTAVLVIMWIVWTYQGMSQTTLHLFLFEVGFLALMTGIAVNEIYNQFGLVRSNIYILPICIAIFAICVFASIRHHQYALLKRTQELLALERQSVHMQTAMLTSQIKPHFLYNTLTSIQEMCYTDPEKAANLIVRFSRYLRKNIDFMDIRELIPFTEELEHVNNYLYIQKERFGNELCVEQNIQIEDFEIPPLSIQPFIENAIKYGIRQSPEGKRLFYLPLWVRKMYIL